MVNIQRTPEDKEIIARSATRVGRWSLERWGEFWMDREPWLDDVITLAAADYIEAPGYMVQHMANRARFRLLSRVMNARRVVFSWTTRNARKSWRRRPWSAT